MKPIKEYIKEDDHGHHYEDENGCYYDDLESFLQCHVLGFCGCGNPETVLKLIHGLVMLKEFWSEKRFDYKIYDEYRTKFILENIESVKWFFDYFLEKKDITTHGGNVSGSWIDDINFLEAITLWHEENKE